MILVERLTWWIQKYTQLSLNGQSSYPFQSQHPLLFHELIRATRSNRFPPISACKSRQKQSTMSSKKAAPAGNGDVHILLPTDSPGHCLKTTNYKRADTTLEIYFSRILRGLLLNGCVITQPILTERGKEIVAKELRPAIFEMVGLVKQLKKTDCIFCVFTK